MKLLSLDCSTTFASVSLFEGDRIVAGKSWHEPRARHEGAFEIIDGLVKEIGWSYADFDLFVVGRGPGAYSGLRVSLLAVQALAAPGNARVIAVSSMDALAVNLMKCNDLQQVTIIGDARRNSIWHGRGEASSLIKNPIKWAVAPLIQLPGVLGAPHVLATPHWNELASIRDQLCDFPWLEGPQIPTAEQVGRLALARLAAGSAEDPLSPLYLHPAV